MILGQTAGPAKAPRALQLSVAIFCGLFGFSPPLSFYFFPACLAYEQFCFGVLASFVLA